MSVPERGRVLVVDDEESMRHFVGRALKREGYTVLEASDAASACALLDRHPIDVLITDIRMPGMDGLELFRLIQEEDPTMRTILISAHGTIRDALAAMNDGAEGFLPKPFERDELLAVVSKATEKARLLREVEELRAQVSDARDRRGLIARSKSMRQLLNVMSKVASHDGTVLISGESGAGKELVARAVHSMGPRSDGPFVAVACAALPDNLVEAELFGVVEGAFTGADRDRPGFVERAAGGTLFLDEVGDIPPHVQPALLRLLESAEVTRVGGTETIQVDVRVICATHQNLRALVDAGEFRSDLFYRLNVLPLEVPPLRERKEDLPLLVTRFLEDVGRPELIFSQETFAALGRRRWTGNVRELRNLVERLAGTHEPSTVRPEDLPVEESSQELMEMPVTGEGYREALTRFERSYWSEVLRGTQGNISEAARRTGISRPSLHSKLSQLGIDARDFR